MKQSWHSIPGQLTLSGLLFFFLAGQAVCQVESPATDFIKRRPTPQFQLRVLCWNVKGSSIYPPDGKRSESFRRIVTAVKPDVICLQEVMGGDRMGKLMDEYLPLQGEVSWQVHSASDNVVISRFSLRHREQELPVPFPLPQFGLPDFRYGQAMCLVDIPEEVCESDFYLIAMHNKSQSGEENIDRRQQQSDSIVRWIREATQTSPVSPISENTPIIILGDMNVYAVEPADPAHHITTLLTGNIIDEKTFGPDFVPDWDGTNLVEVKPRHNATEKDFYTWRVDSSLFPPGALDRIIYTDSVATVNHSYVLNTTRMTKQTLAEHGLQRTDVLWNGESGNFDHLPLVADFSMRKPTTD